MLQASSRLASLLTCKALYVDALRFSSAEFIVSAHNLLQLTEDTGAEVAFLGRSNAGKSSALNTLTGRKLARISKTPGRTQLINLFGLSPLARLVDLPGYGYANVPDHLSKKWQARSEQYLRSRRSLKGLVLLMDIRHPLQSSDCQWIRLCETIALPVHMVLTKADKISKGAAAKQVLTTQKQAQADFLAPLSCQSLSSLKQTGRDTLAAWVHERLTADLDDACC